MRHNARPVRGCGQALRLASMDKSRFRWTRDPAAVFTLFVDLFLHNKQEGLGVREICKDCDPPPAPASDRYR